MPKAVRYCENQCCGRVLPLTMRADARFCCAACRFKRHRHHLWKARVYARWALVGGVERRCEHCGGPMVIGLDIRRADARFCSTGCRVMAHRRRASAA